MWLPERSRCGADHRALATPAGRVPGLFATGPPAKGSRHPPSHDAAVRRPGPARASAATSRDGEGIGEVAGARAVAGKDVDLARLDDEAAAVVVEPDVVAVELPGDRRGLAGVERGALEARRAA